MALKTLNVLEFYFQNYGSSQRLAHLCGHRPRNVPDASCLLLQGGAMGLHSDLLGHQPRGVPDASCLLLQGGAMGLHSDSLTYAATGLAMCLMPPVFTLLLQGGTMGLHSDSLTYAATGLAMCLMPPVFSFRMARWVFTATRSPTRPPASRCA